ncbi:MAG: acyl-CoA thioesterase [Anaerolineae bacterium]|nr:acyl-CoA thioesterase [Anaerolineae bacterium]MCZ7552646.1 acyl-CoA thioesterase [Anaerolineales bacterium]
MLRYNPAMPEFRFFHPIEVRYSDLDPQGHVNNARYLSYFEQARVEYFRQLNLWNSGSFMDFGIILAEARLTFLAPVTYGMSLRAGTRVSRLGGKSLAMDYCLENSLSAETLCTGSAVLVAYDYRSRATIPIPDPWRQAVRQFEQLNEAAEPG